MDAVVPVVAVDEVELLVEVVDPPLEPLVTVAPVPEGLLTPVVFDPLMLVEDPPCPVVEVLDEAAESPVAMIEVRGRSVTSAPAAFTATYATAVVARVATIQSATRTDFFTRSFCFALGAKTSAEPQEKVSNHPVGAVPDRRHQGKAHSAPTLSVVAAIIVIEDDPHIRRLAADALADHGHHVETAAAALEGLKLVVASKPDLVILDLGLPDLDGTELLRMLRAVSNVAVIVATAREGDEHVVTALDAGADDYLVKPYSTAQLEARVRAVLRRAESSVSDPVVELGELRIDRGAREVVLGGASIDLSPKEFDLLMLLADRAGEVVSKRDMLAEVWRQPYGGGDRTIDVHLSSLRSKLGETAASPRYIHTVHGVGVKLVPPGEV